MLNFSVLTITLLLTFDIRLRIGAPAQLQRAG
jgi:hypothetical protein